MIQKLQKAILEWEKQIPDEQSRTTPDLKSYYRNDTFLSRTDRQSYASNEGQHNTQNK